LYSWFFLDEKESLKGITVFVGRLAGCLHTSSITTNGVNTLISVSFSARLRLSKSKTELAPVMPSVSRLDKVKAAIKQEQNGACSSYAEREQTRQSQRFSRFLFLIIF
jgi:hypothetical protein